MKNPIGYPKTNHEFKKGISNLPKTKNIRAVVSKL